MRFYELYVVYPQLIMSGRLSVLNAILTDSGYERMCKYPSAFANDFRAMRKEAEANLDLVIEGSEVLITGFVAIADTGEEMRAIAQGYARLVERHLRFRSRIISTTELNDDIVRTRHCA